jgi:hypothetical protein
MGNSLLPETIERISAAQTSVQLTDGESLVTEIKHIQMILNGGSLPASLAAQCEVRMNDVTRRFDALPADEVARILPDFSGLLSLAGKQYTQLMNRKKWNQLENPYPMQEMRRAWFKALIKAYNSSAEIEKYMRDLQAVPVSELEP